MERLTGKRDGRTYIIGCPDFALPKIVGLIIQQAVDRLAAYEDVGLTPDEVKKMASEWTQYETAMSYVDEIGGIDRLQTIVKADREGRCVVLPVGGYTDKDGENALKSAMNTCFYHNNPVTRYIADAVAEKLTREEAEAALEGTKNG